MVKTCFKCRRSKPIEQFYKHPQMADGHLNKCKSCAKKDVRNQYNTLEGSVRVRLYEKFRAGTERRKLWKREYQRRRRKSNPGKYAANSAVGNALRDGRLIRKPCEVCGNEKSEAHHDDYRKKLDVRWLCFYHHRKLHETYSRNAYPHSIARIQQPA